MKTFQIAALAFLIVTPPMLHAADPFLGKWTLDPKLSKYTGASCPKRMTIEMTVAGSGVHYHSQTQLETGAVFSADYTANYDDVPAMVTGAHGVLLPVSLHRESPGVVMAKYTSGLETRATSRREVSPDGSSMTVTTTSRDGGGIPFTNIGVYKRVPAVANAGFDLSKARGELRVNR